MIYLNVIRIITIYTYTYINTTRKRGTLLLWFLIKSNLLNQCIKIKQNHNKYFTG
jgi:hypothetical protein